MLFSRLLGYKKQCRQIWAPAFIALLVLLSVPASGSENLYYDPILDPVNQKLIRKSCEIKEYMKLPEEYRNLLEEYRNLLEEYTQLRQQTESLLNNSDYAKNNVPTEKAAQLSYIDLTKIKKLPLEEISPRLMAAILSLETVNAQIIEPPIKTPQFIVFRIMINIEFVFEVIMNEPKAHGWLFDCYI